MKAQEIMTAGPACCTPDDTAQEVARLMEENDCGCVPVVEDQKSRRLAGVVTDRDIALRAVIMSDQQVRRVPIIDDAGCTCTRTWRGRAG